MMERMVMVAILTILDQLCGVSVEERILMNEVAANCARRPAPEEIRENIKAAQDNGWIIRTAGLLKETRWARTQLGQAALRDLQG